MEGLCAASFAIADELCASEVLRNDLWQQDVILAGGRLPHPVDADVDRHLVGAAAGDHVVVSRSTLMKGRKALQADG